MAYSGYLLQFGNMLLPNKYIAQNTYSVTPNQRTELSAYRDNNNSLHRATSSNFKTKITFSTTPLELTDKQTIQAIIANGMTDSTERKVLVTYWNDETNSYSVGEFYIPDITFNVIDTIGDSIYYGPISYTLIEY